MLKQNFFEKFHNCLIFKLEKMLFSFPKNIFYVLMI